MLSNQEKFTLCGHARNWKELQALLQKDTPAILLLDLNLKGEDGFTVVEKVQKEFPALKVIILTMYDEPFLIDKARKYKVNAYLLKNSANGELLEALHHVTQSNTFFLPGTLTKQNQSNEAYRDEFIEKMHLTNREIEIIRLVAQGKSAKEIADQLFLSLHTVDTHRRNVLVKLKLKNIADLVRFAFENHLL